MERPSLNERNMELKERIRIATEYLLKATETLNGSIKHKRTVRIRR